jgi:hypothetical protein
MTRFSRRPWFLALALAAAAAACASGQDDDDGSADAEVAQVDAAPAPDAAGAADAALPAFDAAPVAADAAPGMPDAPPPAPDAAAPDAAPMSDAGTITVCAEAALLADNDACAAAIDLTAAATMPGGVTTYGDTTGYADDLEPPSACTGGFVQDGPDAMYTLTATAGQTLTAVMTPVGYDGSIYLVSKCNDATSCVAGVDDGFTGGAETLVYPVPSTGSYTLVVDAFTSMLAGCYTLHVKLE